MTLVLNRPPLLEAVDPVTTGWPETRDLRRPLQWSDNQAITMFDYASRTYIQGYQYRRIARMIGHARANSAWWADHLRSVPETGEASWSDLPKMDRVAFREAAAPAPCRRPSATDRSGREPHPDRPASPWPFTSPACSPG